MYLMLTIYIFASVPHSLYFTTIINVITHFKFPFSLFQSKLLIFFTNSSIYLFYPSQTKNVSLSGYNVAFMYIITPYRVWSVKVNALQSKHCVFKIGKEKIKDGCSDLRRDVMKYTTDQQISLKFSDVCRFFAGYWPLEVNLLSHRNLLDHVYTYL